MARADTPTKLPLDEWARLMGINPLHFNQVNLTELQNDFCGQLWFQHRWQNNTAIGREAISEAIAEAEANIERYIGYSLLATWRIDERRPAVRANRPELVNIGTEDVRWYNQIVISEAKKWITGGQRATTLIEADATIVYTDEDADGYDETATVTVAAGALSETCEIKAFFPGKAADSTWEIKPLRSVTLTGANFVLVFNREQAVLESLQEALNPGRVEGTADDSFLTEVDIYRVFNDPQSQASLLWEPLGSSCSCNGGGCESCAYASQTACVIARGDPENAILAYHPATWDSDEEQFDATRLALDRTPDLVRLWYLAGNKDNTQECPLVTMEPYWARIVARYATAIIPKEPCGCTESDFERWQEDLSYLTGADQLNAYQLAPRELSNPFGTRRGAVEAWRAVNGPGVPIGVGSAIV